MKLARDGAPRLAHDTPLGMFSLCVTQLGGDTLPMGRTFALPYANTAVALFSWGVPSDMEDVMSSNFRLQQCEGESGVTIVEFDKSTGAVFGTMTTTISMSPALINIFNAAPQDDRAALQWGASQEARTAHGRLIRWLWQDGVGRPQSQRWAFVEDLWSRQNEARAAFTRLNAVCVPV